jgi:polysaccharide biosynthesis transport protein
MAATQHRPVSVLEAPTRLQGTGAPDAADTESPRSIREIMNQSSFPFSTRIAVAQDDADRFIDLEQLAAIALRRSRIVALCAVIGAMLGILYITSTPARYTTQTSILIDDSLARFADDKQAPPAAAMQSDALLSSEVEILKSERLAKAVVQAEKLDKNDAFLNPPMSPLDWAKSTVKGLARSLLTSAPQQAQGEGGDGSAAEPGRDPMVAAAVAILQDNLDVERAGRSFVVQLSYTSEDPQLAGRIARAYANAYLADQLEANFEATQRATEWLQGRIAELRDSSQAAASAVEKFRAEHGLTSARGELISDQQLADLNSQLILAQADTANALARYNQFKVIVDSGPDNAVKNATVPVEKGAGGSNLGVINDLKAKYGDISKREREITAKFGQEHPQAVALRREQADLNQQIFHELQQLTESYRNEYEVARSREDSLRANVGLMARQSSQSSQDMVKLRELQQKSDALSALYQGFLSRHEEASQRQSFPIAKARVISEAGDPTLPSSPRKGLALGLSLVLGLFGGAATAALQEFRERFFRTGDDVRSALNVNFLGYLPLVRGRKPAAKGAGDKGAKANGKGVTANGMAGKPNGSATRDGKRGGDPGGTVAPRLLRVAVNLPSSSFAETLRNTKLAADVVLQDRPCKVLGFASVLPGEGKTTVAANFAALIAANGLRTLLIDGDLRNPGLTRGLSLTPDKGLVEAIIGDQRWQSTIMVDRSTNLAIIPASVRPGLSHTSELISGPGMRNLLAEARKSYDYIIVDLPPLGPVIDTKAFAPLADGFVLIAEWGETPRALVRAMLQGEPQISGRLLGMILNKTDLKKLARYGGFGSSEQYLDRYAAYYVDQAELKPKT